MAAHKSFKTSERLAPLAIISSVRFSAANRDSACDRGRGICLARCRSRRLRHARRITELYCVKLYFVVRLEGRFRQALHID